MYFSPVTYNVYIKIYINYHLLFLKMLPNEDLRILKECVSIRDKLLQKKYEEHKVKENVFKSFKT